MYLPYCTAPGCDKRTRDKRPEAQGKGGAPLCAKHRPKPPPKPACDSQGPLCNGQLLQRYGVNGSEQEGKTFHLCGACAVYIKRGGSRLRVV